MILNGTCATREPNITVAAMAVLGFRAYITPLLVVFGGIGNILVVITFSLMQRKSPCRFNIYVIGMTVAQTMELILNAFLDDFLGRGLYWLSDCTRVYKFDVLSNASCKFFGYTPEVAAFISTNILALFSIDRVITIYQPLRYRGDLYRRYTLCGIAFIYIISFILHSPIVSQYGLIDKMSNSGQAYVKCGYVRPTSGLSQYTLYLSIIGSTIFPYAIVLCANVLIIFKLRIVFKQRSSLGMSDEAGATEFRRIAGHLAITTCYCIFTIPLVITIILRQQSDRRQYNKYYPHYAKELEHLSRLFSSMESLSYGFQLFMFLLFLPAFRRELRNIVYCDYQTRNVSSTRRMTVVQSNSYS